MSDEQRKVLVWLRRHNVPRRLRRWLTIIWSKISMITGKLVALLQARHRFFTALLIGALAALVLAKCPLAGALFASLGFSIAVLAGCVEELKAAFKR